MALAEKYPEEGQSVPALPPVFPATIVRNPFEKIRRKEGEDEGEGGEPSGDGSGQTGSGQTKGEGELEVDVIKRKVDTYEKEFGDSVHTIYDLYENNQKVGSVLLHQGEVVKKTNNINPINDLLEVSKQEGGKQIQIISGYRTQKEQNALYQAGEKKYKEKVKNFVAKRSLHTTEIALDVFIPGYSKKQAGDALYSSGRFPRLSIYSHKNTVHFDYGKNKRGYWLNWETPLKVGR